MWPRGFWWQVFSTRGIYSSSTACFLGRYPPKYFLVVSLRKKWTFKKRSIFERFLFDTEMASNISISLTKYLEYLVSVWMELVELVKCESSLANSSAITKAYKYGFDKSIISVLLTKSLLRTNPRDNIPSLILYLTNWSLILFETIWDSYWFSHFSASNPYLVFSLLCLESILGYEF